MSIKIGVLNRNLNINDADFNYLIIFTDINNIKNYNYNINKKIVLKEKINNSCTNIKNSLFLSSDFDVKYPYANEIYIVNGYKINIIFINSLIYSSDCIELIKKQTLFIKEQFDDESDYLIILSSNNPLIIKDINDFFDKSNKKVLIITEEGKSTKNIINNVSIVNINEYDGNIKLKIDKDRISYHSLFKKYYINYQT